MNNRNKKIGQFCRRMFLLMTFQFVLLGASAQYVAVKNNLLYDVTATPNLGLELRMSPKWTAGVNFGFNPFSFSNDRKWKHLLVAPEARYWFCDVFAGHFLGFNAFYSHYNVGHAHFPFPFGLYPSVRQLRKQGDAYAAGLFYGYSWILSPRWSLEAEAGVDVGYTHYKEYECAHCGAYLGKKDKVFATPKLGINIVYNIK